jgi:hypothetical protein
MSLSETNAVDAAANQGRYDGQHDALDARALGNAPRVVPLSARYAFADQRNAYLAAYESAYLTTYYGSLNG